MRWVVYPWDELSIHGMSCLSMGWAVYPWDDRLVARWPFFQHNFCIELYDMYPTLPSRSQTRNLFRPKCAQIPLCHNDGPSGCHEIVSVTFTLHLHIREGALESETAVVWIPPSIPPTQELASEHYWVNILNMIVPNFQLRPFIQHKPKHFH